MPKLKSLIEPNIRLNQDRNEYILESSKRIKLYKISNIIDCHFKAFDSWKIANYLTSNNPKYQHLTVNQLIEQWDSIKEYRVDLRDQIGSYINDHHLASQNMRSKQLNTSGRTMVMSYLVMR